jgi:hypothetical protein
VSLRDLSRYPNARSREANPKISKYFSAGNSRNKKCVESYGMGDMSSSAMNTLSGQSMLGNSDGLGMPRIHSQQLIPNPYNVIGILVFIADS